MLREQKPLKVMYGSIYKQDESYMIDTMAMVMDVTAGMMKWGDRKDVKPWYDNTVKTYNEKGLNQYAKELAYIEFDRYETVLTMEEICTFANYVIMVSCNAERILEILGKDAAGIKEEIAKLEAMGF